MKDLNFLAGKDATWIENNFEPIPKGYILGKDDVICDMKKAGIAKYNDYRFAFYTNFSLSELPIYNYDIYDVKYDKRLGKIVGYSRKDYISTTKYPSFYKRNEHTLDNRNYYMFKKPTPKFIKIMNWPNITIEGFDEE